MTQSADISASRLYPWGPQGAYLEVRAMLGHVFQLEPYMWEVQRGSALFSCAYHPRCPQLTWIKCAWGAACPVLHLIPLLPLRSSCMRTCSGSISPHTRRGARACRRYSKGCTTCLCRMVKGWWPSSTTWTIPSTSLGPHPPPPRLSCTASPRWGPASSAVQQGVRPGAAELQALQNSGTTARATPSTHLVCPQWQCASLHPAPTTPKKKKML